MKVCIGDKIIIKPSPDYDRTPVFLTNWVFKMYYFNDGAFNLLNLQNVSGKFFEKEIDEATFGGYVGKSITIEITGGGLKERSHFLISGIYHQFNKTNLLLGLLGENMKKLAEGANDWQEGHLKSQIITSYNDSNLTDELNSYEFQQTFHSSNMPDARFQTYKVNQKETV